MMDAETIRSELQQMRAENAAMAAGMAEIRAGLCKIIAFALAEIEAGEAEAAADTLRTLLVAYGARPGGLAIQ